MPGLEWKKLDLHVHTPASTCFLMEGEEVYPECLVEAALAQGLNGIAITDHMTGEWIDRIKDAAKGTDLIVFPAVELSVQSFHVIALFPREYTTKDIEDLLSACDVQPAAYGRTDMPIMKDPEEVFEKIHDRGGLAVLAHIDCESSGAWHTAGKGNVTRRLFNDCAYDAVEIKGEEPPEELCNTRIGKSKGYKRLPPWYRASDNPNHVDSTKHSLSGIGVRYSHFKGESGFLLESLRQCFRDPEQRIRQQGEVLATPHPSITGMKVQGGFLDGTSISFHEELTSIVGGKGVGKSLVVEFLRLALGDVSGIEPIAVDHKSKVIEQLGPDGQIRVRCINQAGIAYQIDVHSVDVQKGADGSSYSTSSTILNLDTEEIVEASPKQILPITAFSQGEVIEISRRKSEQLLELDSFVDLEEVTTLIQELLEQFEECLDSLLASRTARSRVNELKGSTSALREEITALEKSLEADIFTRFKEHETADSLVNQALEGWEKLEDPISSALESLEIWKPTLQDDDDLSRAYVKKITSSQQQTQKAVLKLLREALTSVSERKIACADALEPWNRKFATVEKEYDDYIAEAGTRKSLFTKRGKLKKKYGEVKTELEQAEQLAGQWQETWTAVLGLAQQLDVALQRHFQLRLSKARELTKLSNGVLRISVSEASDRSSTLQVLKNVQSGLHTPTLQTLVGNVASQHLVLLLLDPDYGCEYEIQTEQLERLRERILSLDTLTSVLKSLLRSLPEDTPLIEYRKSRGEYAPIEEVSQGQRCTALITLALLEGTTPVIIDQPEDSLDIRAVWDDIATSVRRKKSQRQFIFTTHNSTIAVAADSDTITVLEPLGTRAKKTHEGSIDLAEIKESAIQHLEGGTKAYSLRRQKYNVREGEE